MWDNFPKITEQSMKDLDPKETMDTLRQMKQKDRLAKLELTNKLLASRKEVMETCLEHYEEMEDIFKPCLEEEQNKLWKICQRPNHQ